VNENLIYIAKISSSHGLKGELKVFTFLNEPTSIINFKTLFDANGKEIFTIEKVRMFKKNIVIVNVLNISNKDRAEKLLGKKIYIDKKELKKINENEYYYNDLVKLKVEDEEGNFIGTIVNVYDFGAGNVIEIKKHSKSETFMLPFDKSFFPKVMLGKKIIVSLPVE
tara:strand:+ start:599 stop:1099 length:501 start_codon:yes stop_codon:yes gene_type:complete